jgi:DNA-binding GntR family transcriptional regulator
MRVSAIELPSLSTDRLGTKVYEVLRAAIISGQLRAGELYSAPRLGAAFGISPTPVREALLALVNEGLLTTQRNKGFRVVEISDEDLDEALHLRLLVELPATVDLAGRLNQRDLLDELAEAIVQAANREDVLEFLETDRRFHMTLLTQLGNRRLTELVGHLRDQVRLYNLQNLASGGRLIESAREHRAILDALVAGDRTATEAHLRRHLLNTRGIWARDSG